MAVFKRGEVWHWRVMIQGHIFAKSTKLKDRKAAEALGTLWEAEAIREVMLAGTKPVNHHAVIKAFLDARAGTVGGVNAETHLRHFLAIPNKRMADLTLAELTAVVQKRRDAGIAHNTLVVMVGYWNACVKFAEDHKWTSAVKIPRMQFIKTRLRYLSPDEEERIFRAIDPDTPYPGKTPFTDAAKRDNMDLLIGLFQTGARFKEIAHMTWDQVDLANRKVMLIRCKGGIDSTAVMSDKLFEMFSRRKSSATTQYVFPTKLGSNSNHQWMHKALKKAGIDTEGGKVSLHTARHTFASRMLQSGLSLVEVKGLLGHNNIQSTMQYAHVETGTVANRAAEILNRY